MSTRDNDPNDQRDVAREPVRATEETRVPTRRAGGTEDNPFFIDPKVIPPGVTYEYKRHTTLGQVDEDHLIAMREMGWTPVPAKRHPHMTFEGGSAKGHILKRGMILMERPVQLTQEARMEDNQRAKSQVRDQERRLGVAGQGQFDRTLAKTGRTFENVPIPE